MKNFLLAALFALAALGARAEEKKHDGFSELTVDQVADLIARKDADIFDNNEQATYAKAHLPGARWVSFKDVKEGDLPKDHSRKLVFYCANPH